MIIQPQPQAQVLTKEQKVRLLVSAMKHDATFQFNQLVSNWVKSYNNVWENADGLTPLEVITGFGTDARELFVVSYATQQYINSIAPGTLPQVPSKTPTFKNDGSIASLE